MRKVFHLVFLITVLQTPIIWGQSQSLQAPPLDSLIDEALRNNPQIQSVRYQEQAVEQQIDQMGAWMPPEIGFDFYHIPVDQPNPFTDNFENDYMVSQMIPFPGKISARVNMARSNFGMAKAQRQDQELELIVQVKKRYFELWMIQKQLEVNRDIQQLMKDFVESSQQKFEVEMASLEAVLKAQTELSKLKTEERVLQNDFEKMLVMLNTLLNRNPRQPLGIITTLPPEIIPADLNNLEQTMLTVRPDIQEMRHNLQMNEARLKLARREYFPDLMVRFMYKQMLNDMPDFYSLMFSVQVPLAPWSNKMFSRRIEEANLLRRSAEEALENMEIMAKSQLLQAQLELQTQKEVIELYRNEVLPKAEQTLSSAMGAFETGRGDYLMVIDAARMLEMFRMEFFMALANFHQAIAELERQLGFRLSYSN